ncbi:hypothetical protein HY640_01520 [Candidatus Woesearchaeota archaeon]|nr:hypothetical protein [Candidatus Woesearchaeota archaeon]
MRRKEGFLIALLVACLSGSSLFAYGASGDNFNADRFNYWIVAVAEKGTFSFNETVEVTGSLKRSNISYNKAPDISVNQTDYYAVGDNFTMNLSVLNFSSNNSPSMVSFVLVNTSSGVFRTRSSSFSGAVALYAPYSEGEYILRVQFEDSLNSTSYSVDVHFAVFSQSVDKVLVFPDKSGYYAGDPVVVTGSARRQASDSLVPVSNFSLNGTVRRSSGVSDSILSSFSCRTSDSGDCSVNLSAPSGLGTYVIEVNNFVASSSFRVVPFDVSVYVKDSAGTGFKEILTTNEQASVEVKVTKNSTAPNGTFVFNGTIADYSGRIVANITSTKLNDTNGFINRFQFSTGSGFSEGVYKVSVDVFESGGGNISASASFQVRSWTMYLTKSSDNSGFEYEYSAFPVRNVTFEVYPKERANGTLITTLNQSHFNVTFYDRMRNPLLAANATFNSSCGTQGCYRFSFTTPNVTGSYTVSVVLNFSDVVQSSERSIKVTDLVASAYPSTQEGALKEVFSTTEFVFVSVDAKNTTGPDNVTNVTLGFVVYENGTVVNYTRVPGWGDVDANNSVLEWAYNDSVDRVMLDAPTHGGSYSIRLFINNNTGAALTSFIVNPYDVCAAAKSSAGSIDSSNSWYVWQFKSTDTVYVELKITRAENPSGRAPVDNSTSFNSQQYGMGRACSIDTTKRQVITNASMAVDKVINMQSGASQPLNTTASVCSADNDQGQYTCTIKPEGRWSGGRHLVVLKVTGPDGQTTDKAVTIFEARSFYIWAYANNYAWVQRPVSNITFNVRLYEAGSNWWSNWYSNSQNGGISGSITVERVSYMGDFGEWIWPPIDYQYNITGVNSSNVTNGWGSFSITHDRTPRKKWQTGSYSVTIKGTNDVTGETDYGEAWFSVRQWEAYSTPIESGTYNYKSAYSPKENISLYVRIYDAGSYSDSGGASLGGNVSIGVKKIQFYQSGSYRELNSSLFSFRRLSVNVSSPWYSGASDTYRSHVLNISRASGAWDGGWYNVVLDINGTETGYGWFNVIPFNVDAQPVNSSGSYAYSTNGNGPVYFNITTTRNKKSSYSWYSRGDYINATIKDVVLRTWKSDTWENVEFNYPEDLNVSPLSVNGTALVYVNRSWDPGYYSGEVTMVDSENSTATGYLWFSVQPFRLSASAVRYTVDVDGNASFSLFAYDPDWTINSVVPGNYSIAGIVETLWSGSGYSKITYANYTPGPSQAFNGSTVLNISPNSGAWSLANGGYRSLAVTVMNNGTGKSQTTWLSFRVVSVAVSIGAVPNRYGILRTQNVTLPVTVARASSGAGTIGNLSRVYEMSWPHQTAYNFSIGSCSSAVTGTCSVNSTQPGGVNGSVEQNVTLIAPADGWPEGYHSLNIEFTSASDSSQRIEAGTAWFSVPNPYSAYWYSEDANASWQYYFGTSDNITFRIHVLNSTQGCLNAHVNVSRVEFSPSSNSCWSDYCRKFYEYSFTVINQTVSWIPANSITVGGNELNCSEKRAIRVFNNGSAWSRGQYYIRVTVNGSQGTSVLKTGYFSVKDTQAPNATIHSPAFNTTVNGSLFVNVSTSEPAMCNMYLVSYDKFKEWYCGSQSGNSSNNTLDTSTVEYRSCNSAGFNGSSYSYAYTSNWYSDGGEPGYTYATGGTEHTFNFSISRLPATQHYAIDVNCFDDDWNYVNRKVAFRVNVTNSTASSGNASGNGTVNVSLEAPADSASLSIGSELNLSFRVNHSTYVSQGIWANCSLFSNFTGSWAMNSTHELIFLDVPAKQVNFTPNHSTTGTYRWGVLCNATNSSGAWSVSNRTFTLSPANNSSAALSINQTEPNGTAFSNTSATVYAVLNYNVSIASFSNLNCSLYTNHTGSWVPNISNNQVYGSSNFFAVNFTGNGTHLWNIYCTNVTETVWAQNRTLVSRVNNGSVSSTINVTLLLPANSASQAGSSPVTFWFNWSASRTSSVNCSLYANFTSSWAVNSSTTGITSVNSSWSLNHSTAGHYKWGVYCVNQTDSSVNSWSLGNFTFSLT